MSKPTAVVLFNLGGPDSLDAVEPFLFNLFSDPDIIKLPLGFIFQKPFARMISKRRAPEAGKGYAAIGGKSPILDFTNAQAQGLQRQLAAKGDYAVHVCMRYWHPMASDVVKQLQMSGIERVILLPLYPQYSNTTSGSSFNDFQRACERYHYQPEMIHIQQWFDDEGYHHAIAEAIRKAAGELPDTNPDNIELLFSAHGLPKKLVEQGDPYQSHIEQTYNAVRKLLGWPHTQLCYQSRVGPLEWLKPYTADVIRDQGRTGCKQMLVYPIAFVSDHVETLYELGIEYRELATEAGIEHYRVVPALNDDPLLIDVLAKLVLAADHG